MKYNWVIPLSSLNVDIKKVQNVLKIENYKLEKVKKINSKAIYGMKPYIELYDTETMNAHIWASERFGIKLEPQIYNPIKVDIDIKLRGYQVRPLSLLIEKPYWLLYAEVAFGKSHTTAWLINHLKCRTVIMTNTQVNAEQLVDRLSNQFWDDRVWIFYWPKKQFKDITVCVYNSYDKLLDLHNWQFDLLIQDECDLLLSENYRSLTINTKSQYKYWLTWTPFNDSFTIEDMALYRGRIVRAKEYNDRLRKQFNIKVRAVEVGEIIDEYSWYHDLKRQSDKSLHKMETIKKIAEEMVNKGKKVLVLTDRKEITENINKQLWYPYLTWELSKKKRLKMFEEFENKKVLCSVQNIVWRWYDDPEIDCVVIAFSWRAAPRIIQSLGRGLRTNEWKIDIDVRDIVDKTPMLKYQWYARKKVYEEYTKDIVLYHKY